MTPTIWFSFGFISLVQLYLIDIIIKMYNNFICRRFCYPSYRLCEVTVRTVLLSILCFLGGLVSFIVTTVVFIIALIVYLDKMRFFDRTINLCDIFKTKDENQ